MKNYPNFLKDHPTSLFKITDPQYHLYDHLAYFFIDHYPLYMHSHDFYELNIVVSGYGRHYIENNNYPMQTGDVFVIPPFLKHGYYALSEHLNIFHLLIDSSIINKYQDTFLQFSGYKTLFLIEPQLRVIQDMPPFFLHLNEANFENIYPKLTELIDLSNQYEHIPSSLFNIHTAALICDLSNLIYLRNQSLSQNESKSDLYKILLSVDYMEKNYDQRISIKILADLTHVSSSTYLRYFKKLFHCTPIEYLTRIRIQKSTHMLLNSNLQITQIAQNCGFYDSSHFSDTFFKLMHKTPSSYRKDEK